MLAKDVGGANLRGLHVVIWSQAEKIVNANLDHS